MTELSLRHEFTPATREAPVLLLLHGTGGTPRDLVDLGRRLSPDSAMLAPAGPVSENGAPRWFRREAEGVFDTEDVVARTHQLADFIGEAREHYGISQRLVAVGFSNGANIAAALTLLRPDVLREAVLFAAMLPVPDPPRNDLTGSRVFLSNGQRDPMAPNRSVDDLVSALRERGAGVSAHRHSGGHQIAADDVDRAWEWLHASTTSA